MVCCMGVACACMCVQLVWLIQKERKAESSGGPSWWWRGITCWPSCLPKLYLLPALLPPTKQKEEPGVQPSKGYFLADSQTFLLK